MEKRGKFETGVEAGRNDAALKDAALKRAEPGRPGRSRVRSLAARCLAAVLLVAFAALLALPLQAQAQTTVTANWSLVPSGLGVGDSFRLLVVTSGTRNATATDIATYNTFVQTDVSTNGHTDIQSHSSIFKVLGCTTSTSAIVNTSTAGSDTSAPIYWLNGNKVANYADLYDGGWDSNAPKFPDGTTPVGNASRTFRRFKAVIQAGRFPGFFISAQRARSTRDFQQTRVLNSVKTAPPQVILSHTTACPGYSRLLLTGPPPTPRRRASRRSPARRRWAGP